VLANDNKHEPADHRGRWFTAVGYWLYPKGLEFTLPHSRLDALKKAMYAAEAAPDLHPPAGEMDVTTARVFSDSARRYVLAMEAYNSASYNAQPKWHLRDLKASVADAHAVITEFVKLTSITSSEYFWPGLNSDGNRWHIHGWKHICLKDIEDQWKEYTEGETPGVIIAEGIGDDELRSLFRAAQNRDPEAIGRVWTLFPKVEEHEEIYLWYVNSNDRPKAIPDPITLAGEFVNTIFSRPRSEEATQARTALLKLISPSVSHGVRAQKGRPKNLVPPSIVSLVSSMSCSLARQIREVRKFLSRLKMAERDQAVLLLGAYPWLGELKNWDLLSFLELAPSSAGLVIAEHVTGISQRAVERKRTS
jgi:hypothetical protein